VRFRLVGASLFLVFQHAIHSDPRPLMYNT
jgi:hypothetical protein